MHPNLTIVIPTYKRPKQLLLVLRRLRVTDHTFAEVLILDNGFSTDDQFINQEISYLQELGCNVRIVKRVANIGGSSNILSGFYEATSEYVWILSDDDIPTHDSISIILESILQYPLSNIFSFYYPCRAHSCRDKDTICKSSIEYLSSAATLGELIFISNFVYRRRSVYPYLAEAFTYQSTFVPQLFLNARLISAQSPLILSGLQIIEERLSDSDHSSILRICSGLSGLGLFSFSISEYNIISKLPLWFSFRSVLYEIMYCRITQSAIPQQLNRYILTIISNISNPPFYFSNKIFLLGLLGLNWLKLDAIIYYLSLKLIGNFKRSSPPKFRKL